MKNLPASIKYLMFGILTILALMSVIQGFNNAILRTDGSQDNQWSPSRILLQHKDPYSAYLDPDQRKMFILNHVPNYPVSGLILLWPYAIWNWQTAKILWLILNLIFTVLIILSVARFLPPDKRGTNLIILSAMFIAGTAWRNCIGNGQQSLFAMAFFMLTFIMIDRSTMGSGLSLALSWLKYSITLPLSLFLCKSKKGLIAILTAVTIHIILTIFASVWTGASPIDLLMGPVRLFLKENETGNINISAILAVSGFHSSYLSAIISLAVMGITYFSIRKDNDSLSCLSTLAVTSMVVCYHRGYDFIVLILPLAYMLREGFRNVRALYYLLAIMIFWFADKAVYTVLSQSSLFGTSNIILQYFFWMKTIVFYGILFADWINAFSDRRLEKINILKPSSTVQ